MIILVYLQNPFEVIFFLIICNVVRFIRQFILLFAMHAASISMFRLLGSMFHTPVTAIVAASFLLLLLLLFSGITITRCKLIHISSLI